MKEIWSIRLEWRFKGARGLGETTTLGPPRAATSSDHPPEVLTSALTHDLKPNLE